MNWFPGNIAEAVNLSKTNNAIFVVYCEGTDEMSTNLAAIINDDKISSKLNSKTFIAIKIIGGSETYTQFAQIYKLVPIPSIFFIGKNGAPLEVITGIIKTVDELESKIVDIVHKAGLTLPQSSDASTSQPCTSNANPTDDDSEIVCEDGVCYKKPKDKKEASSTSPEQQESPTHEEKLRKAKELIEKKRIEKEEEASRLEKEKELQRRRSGQDLQNFKERQEQMEIKKQQEERKRDKKEEQEARQRILAQIAQDKAERNSKLNQSTSKAAEKITINTAAVSPFVTDKSEARIQFKKPDGETDIKVFKSSEKFEIIRAYVEENVIVGSGIREFALATTFPKKEFKTEDILKTLLELNLAPSSVILILPLDKVVKKSLPLQSGGGIFTALSLMFWGILNTFNSTFTAGKAFLLSKINGFRGTGAQKRANENDQTPNDAAKRRNLSVFEKKQPTDGPSSTSSNKSGSAYRRVGGSNVHKLSDIRDSDDENNTWNGNSTQQQ